MNQKFLLLALLHLSQVACVQGQGQKPADTAFLVYMLLPTPVHEGDDALTCRDMGGQSSEGDAIETDELTWYASWLNAIDQWNATGKRQAVLKPVDVGRVGHKLPALLDTLSRVDLIIGPFGKSWRPRVAEFAERHNIPHLSPEAVPGNVAAPHSLVWKADPSQNVAAVMKVALAKYVGQDVAAVMGSAEPDKQLMAEVLRHVNENKIAQYRLTALPDAIADEGIEEHLWICAVSMPDEQARLIEMAQNTKSGPQPLLVWPGANFAGSDIERNVRLCNLEEQSPKNRPDALELAYHGASELLSCHAERLLTKLLVGNGNNLYDAKGWHSNQTGDADSGCSFSITSEEDDSGKILYYRRLSVCVSAGGSATWVTSTQ